MADESSSTAAWIRAAGLIALSAGAGLGGGIGQSYLREAAPPVLGQPFGIQDRLQLERELGGIKAKIDRYDEILSGKRPEMSEAARVRFEQVEARLRELERR